MTTLDKLYLILPIVVLAVTGSFFLNVRAAKFFAAREAKKRRANYDFLRAEITKRHLAGYDGLTVSFKGHKFDRIDMQSFRPPMYQIAKDKNQNYCIFWRKDKMTEEIGPSFFGHEKPTTEVTDGKVQAAGASAPNGSLNELPG